MSGVQMSLSCLIHKLKSKKTEDTGPHEFFDRPAEHQFHAAFQPQQKYRGIMRHVPLFKTDSRRGQLALDQFHWWMPGEEPTIKPSVREKLKLVEGVAENQRDVLSVSREMKFDVAIFPNAGPFAFAGKAAKNGCLAKVLPQAFH